MNNRGGVGISAAILLISFILISITIASIITGGTTETSEENMEEILDDVLDEISTYLQIKDVMGKYYSKSGEQKIEKVAILIKPLISQEIKISELTIKLCDGNIVKMLDYSGNAVFIDSNSLFEHPTWNDISDSNFGFVVIHDKDRSLVDYDAINDNTDMAYIIINLSEEFSMTKGETMNVTLFPSSGIKRTISLDAPLPMKQLVNLY